MILGTATEVKLQQFGSSLQILNYRYQTNQSKWSTETHDSGETCCRCENGKWRCVRMYLLRYKKTNDKTNKFCPFKISNYDHSCNYAKPKLQCNVAQNVYHFNAHLLQSTRTNACSITQKLWILHRDAFDCVSYHSYSRQEKYSSVRH